MSKYNLNVDDVIDIVKNSINFSEVLKKLNIPRRGNNIQTVKKFMIDNNIDFSHFTGRARCYKKPSSTSVSDYIGTHKHISSTKLKKKLIDEGYKENKCEICGCSEWNGKFLNCQLHHINGDHNDNRLENLQILCPNCHSQTDTYSNNKRDKNKNYCPDCGKEITKDAKHCTMCSRKYTTHKNKPDKDVLIEDIKNLKSLRSIGKKYGVSDHTIKKWCINYNIRNGR